MEVPQCCVQWRLLAGLLVDNIGYYAMMDLVLSVFIARTSEWFGHAARIWTQELHAEYKYGNVFESVQLGKNTRLLKVVLI